MTADEFTAATGFVPNRMLLEYANCQSYSPHNGHMYCGVCSHGMPRTCGCGSCGGGDTAVAEQCRTAQGLNPRYPTYTGVANTPTWAQVVTAKPVKAEDPDRILPFSELGLE